MAKYTFRSKWNNDIFKQNDKVFECTANNEIEAVSKLNEFFETSKKGFPVSLIIEEKHKETNQ